MKNMEKQWETLIYQGKRYEQFKISNYGDLMNAKTGHIYKTFVNKNGYVQVCVSLGSKENKKVFKLHKAVAETFIPNPDESYVPNHIDGVKTNNFVGNLEWVSISDNVKHAIKIGLVDIRKFSGVENVNSKLTKDDVIWIRKHYIPYDKEFGTRAMARKFNVAHSTIEGVVHNESYKDV